ncbi:MAG: class C sortase [Actinomycetia bacterium]|nr:class C sortase [Actinomycetes bacterium]
MVKRGIVTLCILLVGLELLLYPQISNYLAEKNSSSAIQVYQEKVSEFDKADLRAAWDAAEEYNESLTGAPVHDPFVEGSGMAMPETYWQTLNIRGVMGFLDIPKIGVNLPIYHGTSEETLNRGVGHLEGSTLPIGGISRHCVLSGHTGLPTARLFTDLIELEEGDTFYINVLDRTLAYQVDQVKVIEPNVTDDLQRVLGKDYCTLVTCTPYGVNSHRLLVRGKRIPYDTEQHHTTERVASSSVDGMVVQAAAITSAVMLGLIVLVILLKRREKRKDDPKPKQGGE